MRIRVILRPDPEDGGFVASCPALPGCHSQGETREEALANVREAVAGYLLAGNERGSLGAKDIVVEVEV